MEISQKVSKVWKYCEKCLAKNGNFDFFVMTLQTACGTFRQRERVMLQTSCGAKRVNFNPSRPYAFFSYHVPYCINYSSINLQSFSPYLQSVVHPV